MLRSLVKRLLCLLGKSDRKIIAVYAASGSRYGEAVEWVRAEEPRYPVWLVATGEVEEAVAQKCDRVIRFAAGFGLPFRVAARLWPSWVVLSVVPWTQERGYFWLKLAPLLVPPWKVLAMNEHGDFFDALPLGIVRHGLRRARDGAATGVESAKDLALGVFWKVVWTALDPLLDLTSRPWLGPAACPPLMPERPVPGDPLLFAERPPPGGLDELRILFERPDTFAASFQPGRAGFQKDVVPRAAFRQLQPGEAAAVAAPLSDVTLVDAAKLARLGGFPRARSRRCQWLLLYFKAVAAGWKSYSVGIATPRAPMIPDRAFAEAEFCFRLLRDKPGRGGGSFDGARGSVCFHPRHQGPLTPGRRRILIVSPYLPFPLSHGGAVRIFNLARQLSGRWDLLLVSFREREDQVDYARLSSVFRRVVVVDQDERRRADPEVPRAVWEARSRAMAAAVQEAAAHYQPDLLQVEYTHMAAYRDAWPQVPAVLVEHDVTFSLHQQLASPEFDRWRRFESHWLKRYEAVAVMSEEEKEKATGAGAPPARTWVVPNGVDTERFQPAPGKAVGGPEILYVGSFRHLPNMVGFEYLCDEILPRLRRRLPRVRLRVVAGPDYRKHWRDFSGGRGLDAAPDARVEGFVEDLAPLYRQAWTVVVPLRVSAGTNIKVLEALACAKPIVSTRVGCAGLGLIEGEEILVADEAEPFAEALLRSLEDAALRRRLGENARRAAVERFSWQRSAERAEEMYDQLLPAASRRHSGP